MKIKQITLVLPGHTVRHMPYVLLAYLTFFIFFIFLFYFGMQCIRTFRTHHLLSYHAVDSHTGSRLYCKRGKLRRTDWEYDKEQMQPKCKMYTRDCLILLSYLFYYFTYLTASKYSIVFQIKGMKDICADYTYHDSTM